MFSSLYIAWKYLAFNKIRTVILIACITLIATLPLALNLVLDQSERQFLERARTTPLILGAKGSSLDLVMNSLYFTDVVPEPVSMEAYEQILQSGLAQAIPMQVRFKARGYPVVGTTVDYFDYRGLIIAEGHGLALLGDCVLGSQAAKNLQLKPGDSLISSPENLFDLAGIYPLKMSVAGILAETKTADDHAVFVDLKTGWVIEGLGHGHENLEQTKENSVILEKQDNRIIANAKLLQFTEINEQNINSFHFHGSPDLYPITAVIALPTDEKARTILLGRYLTNSQGFQLVRPEGIIEELLDNIFKIKSVLDAVILMVGLSTVLALLLVFSLSIKLRQREIDIIFKLGCSRATTARLLFAEILIVFMVSLFLCAGVLLVISHFKELLTVYFFMQGTVN